MRALLAGLLCAATTGVLAGPATADSIVYVKDSNVWLANADGSGPFQVTLDGTASAPYETPSQANDGTILAVRAVPGTRRRLYRMRQNGELLNPPADTPAPGTGAIDAKISPNGQLAAYWFATTVNDPICTFCVSVSNRVLLSRSDRFTGANEIGTPNTGGWPSWLSNDTVTLGSGSATQWYYKLGMPEAAEWFTDADVTGQIKTLLDAEAAPTGDRLAVVRGDNQESILLLKMNGAPPAKPSPASCALGPPSGKFVDPTWSSDGRLLAWQEDDGIWTMRVPANVDDCAAYETPVLRVPGGRNPDLGPAAINPGARPGCGNPGNPAACPPPFNPPVCSPCTPPPNHGEDVQRRVDGLATSAATALRRAKIGGLMRRRSVRVSFSAPGPGTLELRLTSGRRVLASGRAMPRAEGTTTVALKLTAAGKRTLSHARKAKASLRATFTPTGGQAVSAVRAVALRR